MTGLPDVSGTPVAIWLAIVVMLGLGVATVFRNVFGPISRAWYDFAKQRRADAAEKRKTAAEIAAADMAALQEQVNRLEATVKRLTTLESDRDNRAVEHAVWDREVRMTLANSGITVREPPPL